MVAERLPGETLALERLLALPGGAQLLELASAREDVELVGGAVRDILLEREPRELDVVLAGEGGSFASVAADFAAELAQSLGGEVSAHERFGTAALVSPSARIDVATRRAELYPEPGALPEVRPASGQEDLARRDFTANAIAIALGGPRRGQLRSVEHALDDLERRRLRVLHDRSFIDDPTRLLRLCRYAARLRFAVEDQTALLASQALASGALRTVSAARIGAELKLLLAEPDLLATLAELEQRGALAQLCAPAVEPRLRAQTLATALELMPAEGRPDLLALASLLLDVPDPPLAGILDSWEYTAAERKVVLEAATRASRLAGELARTERPSALWRLLKGAAVETVALAGALASKTEGQASGGSLPSDGNCLVPARARTWLTSLRHVRLEITGDDLLAAGLPPGPEIGRALDRALEQRLDEAIEPGREAELSAALTAGTEK